MPFVVREWVTSRRVMLAKDTERATLEFVGFGSSDDTVARLAFAADIPSSFTPFTNPLPLLSWDCWTLGGEMWRAAAEYGPDGAPLYPSVGVVGPPAPTPDVPGPNTPLGPEYSFDFTGVTEKITQSKKTISKTPATAPVGQGAIGVTSDGKVEGCDRISPSSEWSKTVTFGSITTDYIDKVASLIGTVNDAVFYGHAAGTLLFMGGNAQTDDTYKAKVTFKFLKRPNRTNIRITPVGAVPEIVVPEKKGHEYLWVYYGNAKDANVLWQIPKAAYVERIYDEADFAQLRIGA